MNESAELAGVGVLVTRPRAQAATLAALIEAAGGRALRFPVIEILPPLDSAPLAQASERLHEFDLAIFISPNAVTTALNAITARRTWPPHTQIGCVGKGSAKALRQFGLTPQLVPSERFDADALAALPALAEVAGKKIVVFRGDGGREVLSNALTARGAAVTHIECYRRARPEADTAALLRQWARGEIDIVTLTSGQGLRNLYDLLGPLGRQWLIKTPIVVVSERIAALCQALGFKHAPIVAPASDEGIVSALKAWRTRQKSL